MKIGDRRFWGLWIMIFSVMIIMVLLTFQLRELKQEVVDQNEVIKDFTYVSERLQMFNRSLGSEVVVNGVYHSPKGFYCVWTKGRTAEEIDGTANHEKCHALIDEDEEHFCK